MFDKGKLTTEAVEAFKTLKAQLVNRPCLKPVDFNKPFILTVDASNVGLGAILSQKNSLGIENPNAYASRSLNDAEKQYSSHHLESLGMLWACKHFKPYLVGREFTIRTDHKPLVALNRTQGQALERIRAEMEEFLPYKVEYLKGDKMPADGLSRQEINSLSLTSKLTWQQVFKAQLEDLQCKALTCFIKYKQLPQNEGLATLVNELKGRIKLVKGVICITTDRGPLPYAPVNFRTHLLQLAHDSVLSGHYGVEKTFDRLIQDWFWPTMKKDIANYCRECKVCIRNRRTSEQRVELKPLQTTTRFNERVHVDLMGPLPAVSGNKYILVMVDAFSNLIGLEAIPDKTAETVAMAFLTGWIKLHGCPEHLNSDQGSEFTNRMFKHLCQKLNIQHRFSSVMHPQSNGRAERIVREVITYLRKYLEEGKNENQWEEIIPSLQFAYNSSLHLGKRYSPYMIAFNRRPQLASTLVENGPKYYGQENFPNALHLFTKITQDVIANNTESFKTQKRAYDQRIKTRKIMIGDYIYVNRPHSGKQFQKFQDLKMGPYQVIKVDRDQLTALNLNNGKTKEFHINRATLVPFSESIMKRVVKKDTKKRKTTSRSRRPPFYHPEIEFEDYPPYEEEEDNDEEEESEQENYEEDNEEGEGEEDEEIEWDDPNFEWDNEFGTPPEQSSRETSPDQPQLPPKGAQNQPPPTPPRGQAQDNAPLTPSRMQTRATGPAPSHPYVQKRPIEYKSAQRGDPGQSQQE